MKLSHFITLALSILIFLEIHAQSKTYTRPQSLQSKTHTTNINDTVVTNSQQKMRGSSSYLFSPENQMTKNEVVSYFQNLSANKRSQQLAASDSLHLVNTLSDELGFIHYRFQQYYKGIPVDGAILILHEKENNITRVNGNFFPDLFINTNPTISITKAIALACTYANIEQDSLANNISKGELIISPEKGILKTDNLCLSYKCNVATQCVYVNAHTGELVNIVSNVKHSSQTGTAQTYYNGEQEITTYYQDGVYFLYDSIRNIYTWDGTNDSTWIDGNPFENPIKITDEDNIWNNYYILRDIYIERTSNAWYTPISDPSPDFFIKIFDANNTLVYQSEVKVNTKPAIHFYDINLPLRNETYTVKIVDRDYSDPDDLCGTFSIQPESGSGTFSNTETAGSYSISGNGSHVATDVHWGLSKTYDYFFNIHNRKSFDGKGDTINCWINPHLLEDWESSNAFAYHASEWGVNTDFMCFGFGDNWYMNPVVSLDVAAHEFTHQITAYTADLIYQGESGALNESFSDIFGTCVEKYALGTSSNWTVGEEVTIFTPYLRSLSNPKTDDLTYEYDYSGETITVDDRQPDTYKGEFWANAKDYSFDYGGVHQNSSIGNYWFYLLCEGGSGQNDLETDYNVTGIGIEKAEKIAFRTLTVYLTPYAQFKDAYVTSLLAAEDLYGSESDEWWAVKEAWYAVGVINTDPNSFCSGQVLVTDTEGTISDGSGGADYSPYSSCQWLITPPGATSITFDFTEFDIEWDYDFVIIYSSIYADPDYAFFAWTGNELPSTYTIEGGAALVEFISDDQFQAAGWSFNYTTETIDACDELSILTEETGTISDNSNFDENYGNNLDCIWSIATAGMDSVTLDFNYFDTEADYDFVVIFDGEPDFDNLSNVVASYSGNSLPDQITVETDELWIYFSSDPFVSGAGFEIEYTAHSTPFCSGVEVLTSDAGVIHDGSGTASYYRNSECGWLIQPEGAQSITLWFDAFECEPAEEDGRSYYDFIEIYDGEDTTAPLLGKYAGTTLPPAHSSSGGSMFLRFSSDMYAQYDGFTAEYFSITDAYCPNSDIYTEQAGTITDGSGANLYGNNTDCMVLIEPTVAAPITIQFSEFDLEDGEDFLFIYDGSDTTAPLLASYTGSSIPDKISSTGNTVLIWFVSDDAYRGTGWKLQYSSGNIEAQIINLNQGWNLISLYVTPFNPSVEAVFESIISTIEIVKDEALYYQRGQTQLFNQLTELTDGKAYLVKADQATTFTVFGSLLDVSQLQILQTISPGWNLFGSPYKTTTSFNSYFNFDTISDIKTFEGFFTPGSSMNSIENLEPGQGYFVKRKD